MRGLMLWLAVVAACGDGGTSGAAPASGSGAGSTSVAPSRPPAWFDALTLATFEPVAAAHGFYPTPSGGPPYEVPGCTGMLEWFGRGDARLELHALWCAEPRKIRHLVKMAAALPHRTGDGAIALLEITQPGVEQQHAELARLIFDQWTGARPFVAPPMSAEILTGKIQHLQWRGCRCQELTCAQAVFDDAVAALAQPEELIAGSMNTEAGSRAVDQLARCLARLGVRVATPGVCREHRRVLDHLVDCKLPARDHDDVVLARDETAITYTLIPSFFTDRSCGVMRDEARELARDLGCAYDLSSQ